MTRRLTETLLVILAVIAVAPCCPNAEPWGWGSDENQHKHLGQDANREERSTGDGDRPKETCATSRGACQNLHSQIVTEVSAQVKMELTASYVYLAMSNYFSRDDVSLRGFAKFFRAASDEERTHALNLMDYIIKRGASVTFFDIPAPTKITWGNGEEAVNEALLLEKKVNGKLLDLHWTAQQRNDPHFQDFLESVYLTEQVDAIKQLSDWSAILKRTRSDPLGEHIFDQELFDEKR